MQAPRFSKFALLLCLCLGGRGVAQSDVAPVYGAWWSAGWHAPVANNTGFANDRMLLVAGLERRFVFTSGRFGMLSWAPAILPAVNATNNRRLVPSVCRESVVNGKVVTPTFPVITIGGQCYQSEPYSAFGVGVLPLAFHWQTAPANRFGLIADLDGGGVWFNHRLPVTDNEYLNGTQFNFAARAGVDGVVRVTSRMWISAGYRHLHLSNGGFGDVNPGIDAHLLALGVAWR